MWYRRFVSWLRSLFTPSTEVNPQPAPLDSDTPTLPMTAPLREPLGAWDEGMTLPPQMIEAPEFPTHREPPTTVPLARLAGPSEPLTGASGSSDGVGPAQRGWISREPSQPSQPTQPLPEAPQPRDPARLDVDAEFADTSAGIDGGYDEAPVIEPGSDLYRRLMILRRLVRQRVYNEGFAPSATPEQYLRYPGQDDLDNPFSGQ
ncbi:MAG TPA: hypothetical protein VFQ25_06605 [Ktedonobacterales bacterium]|nr:hypothetical protein [Ktedonobacterales bacterium]